MKHANAINVRFKSSPADHVRNLLPQHVDHRNSETFGSLDLEKLIRRASQDLDNLDRKREKEFKEYELQKEYERRQKLAVCKEYYSKNNGSAYRIGSADQMEEVWEDVDHLEPEQFNAKTFFSLHDTNTDGFLDEDEIEALMLKEAEKIHNNTTDGDPVEKQEELDRMREHVMKEFDKNSDRMLSYEEFMTGMNGTGAKNDQGWDSIEDKPVYSDQEFQQFSEHMIDQATIIKHPIDIEYIPFQALPLPLHQQQPKVPEQILSQQQQPPVHIERQKEQQNSIENSTLLLTNNQGHPGQRNQNIPL
ncbi:unnamed protein product [Didymodactylos carnosus]|uniref:EF-hand domain-containing protein n=1 Tax=Didymodactylos carnosus TaxID=1234261 RepID=A0A815EXV0_9BILA|nr:unnamed protein product [Didymodactylos carnosus]CAF4150663.1 unnamed protein product [Didymodactylos carnosus]